MLKFLTSLTNKAATASEEDPRVGKTSLPPGPCGPWGEILRILLKVQPLSSSEKLDTTKIQEELIGENTTNTEEIEIHVSERQFSLLGLVDHRVKDYEFYHRVKDYEFLLNFQLLSTSENLESVRPTTPLKK